MKIAVKVPASTANLGPGFDVLGAGLSLFLTLTLTTTQTPTILEYDGDSPSSISLDPTQNFITRIMQYMANAYNMKLPSFHLKIENPIPLGRGLGSSGTAVVGAIALANELLGLKLSKNDLLDYSTMIEGHPDNVGGSIYGWNISFSRGNLPIFDDNWFNAGASVETPSSVIQNTRRNWHMNEPKQQEERLKGNLVSVIPIQINQTIKCVVAIPTFSLPTVHARQVLPTSYSRKDCVFNMGRVSALTHLLCQAELQHEKINEAMHDMIHQPYRAPLVPGLLKALNLGPKDITGLLGVGLSGAGPTVLALATENFEIIGQRLQSIFNNENVDADCMVLEFESGGVQIQISQ